MRVEKMALSPLYCLVTEGLAPGGLFHPVGRPGFLTHWYQRVGALQMPVAVNVDHPDLWGRTQFALREADALKTPGGRIATKQKPDARASLIRLQHGPAEGQAALVRMW